jgi:hypothetical protein
MPEATKEVEDGRPTYSVHGKMFCFHRAGGRMPSTPRRASSSTTCSAFRVADLGVKEMLLGDARGIYFTTPHWTATPPCSCASATSTARP